MDYRRLANPFGGMASAPRTSNPTRRPHDPDILFGMAKVVFADRWAQKQEEKGRSFSGQDIYDVSPAPNREAKKWARETADKIVAMNGKSLEDLYEVARSFGYSRDRESFGADLGMQAVGHGVSWQDRVSQAYGEKGRQMDAAIKLPRTEFYY